MTEDDIKDHLLGMGVGQVARFGPAKVLRPDSSSWLVAGAGTSREFGVATFAARWIALLAEDAPYSERGR